MAILLAYIDAESVPIRKPSSLPVPATTASQRSYPKAHIIKKVATAPQEVAAGESPVALPPAPRFPEPDIHVQGPVAITRPTGCKIVPPDPEGLDPITLFNTQFNSRRFASSASALEVRPKRRTKRHVSFAREPDVIPPVCTDLVLYREYGPDSFRLNKEAWEVKVRRVLCSVVCVLCLVILEYHSLAFLARGEGFLRWDFTKALLA